MADSRSERKNSPEVQQIAANEVRTAVYELFTEAKVPFYSINLKRIDEAFVISIFTAPEDKAKAENFLKAKRLDGSKIHQDSNFILLKVDDLFRTHEIANRMPNILPFKYLNCLLGGTLKNVGFKLFMHELTVFTQVETLSQQLKSLNIPFSIQENKSAAGGDTALTITREALEHKLDQDRENAPLFLFPIFYEMTRDNPKYAAAKDNEMLVQLLFRIASGKSYFLA